jgi:hypothetical protein
MVAEALKKEFPERYNVLPLAEAWRRLWRQKYFVPASENPSNTTHDADDFRLSTDRNQAGEAVLKIQ